MPIDGLRQLIRATGAWVATSSEGERGREEDFWGRNCRIGRDLSPNVYPVGGSHRQASPGDEIPLGPPGRKDDRAQRAAERMVPELGGEICDHRSLNVSESLWTPVHDGDVDGIAFD